MNRSLLPNFKTRQANVSRVRKTKNILAGIVLAALILISSNVLAEIFTTKGTGGNWSSPASWTRSGSGSGNTPGINDDVIILSGHNINLNAASVYVRSLTFQANGIGTSSTLNLGSNTLTVSGNIKVNPDGLITAGAFTANIQGVSPAAFIQANALLINGSDATSKTAQCNIATRTFINGDVAFNSLSNSRLELQADGVLIVSGSLGTPASPGYIETMQSSSIILNGGTAQHIPALVGGYHNLKIEGGAKTLAASTTISGNLDITNGALLVGANTLTLEPAATITRTPNGNFIDLTGGGQMVYKGVGTTPKEFPVGQSNSFTPVIISNSGTVQDFTVSLVDGVRKYGQPVSFNVVNKIWNITPSGAGANAAITLQWNDYNETYYFSRAVCGISHWDAAKNTWEKEGVIMTAASPGSILGSYTISRSGIQSFSPFAVGDANSPLPVELLYFHASKKENATVLTWETAAEKNNTGFEVQVSADGTNYEAIGLVATQNGDANYNQRYEFLDKASRSGLVYYRLKQTDQSGAEAFYPAKVLDLGTFINTVDAYPNPFQNEFHVDLPGAAQLEVTDLTGKVVYRTASPVTGTVNIELNDLPSGLYLLETTAAGQTTIARIIKQ